MANIARRIRKIAGRIFPVRDYVEVSGSIIPSRDMRWCGPEFRDNEYYLRSAEGEARRLVEHFACGSRSRVLDVGSGQGRLPIGILRVVGALDYLGIDIHRSSIEWCQRHIESRHPTFRFRHLDLYNERYNPGGKRFDASFRFDLAPASVDIVYLYSVFSHTTEADMRVYLTEFARALAPAGGVFFTTFVERDVPDISVNPENYRLKCSGPLHIVRYREDYLFSILAEHGFEVRHSSRGTEADGQSAIYLGRARA